MWINTDYGSVQDFKTLQKLMTNENLESVKISVELLGQKFIEQTVTIKDVQQLVNETK